MKSTAEVWVAVTLGMTGAACFSFCCILAALTPDTQRFTTALPILSTGLKEQDKCARLIIYRAVQNSWIVDALDDSVWRVCVYVAQCSEMTTKHSSDKPHQSFNEINDSLSTAAA